MITQFHRVMGANSNEHLLNILDNNLKTMNLLSERIYLLEHKVKKLEDRKINGKQKDVRKSRNPD